MQCVAFCFCNIVGLCVFTLFLVQGANIGSSFHQKTCFECFLKVVLCRNVSAVFVLVGLVVAVVYETNIKDKSADPKCENLEPYNVYICIRC